MATLTLAGLRTVLTNRNNHPITRLSITSAELDEAINAGFRLLYPSLFKRVRTTGVAVNSSGECTVVEAATVNRVEATVSGELMNVPFEVLDDATLRVADDNTDFTTCTVYSHTQYDPPTGVASIPFPDRWLDLLYLAAEVALYEQISSERTQFRGFRPNENVDVDLNEILNLHSAKSQLLDAELARRAMQLPPARVD